MALLRVKQADVGRRNARHAQLLGRGHHFGDAVQDAFTFLVDQQAVEFNGLFIVLFRNTSDRHVQRIANSHRATEVQVLLQVNRARAWEHGAQQTADERAAPHAVTYDAMKQSGVGVRGVEVCGVRVTRHGGEGLDVGQSERAHQACRLPHHDAVVGVVF